MMKESEIKFLVTLDDEQIPERIQWEAGDSGKTGKHDCGATMLAIWDTTENATLRIDLWTKAMPVDDMKRFFYDCFTGMADTFERATQDPAGAGDIRKFAETFAGKAELFRKK
ncbi:MAG: gliding motility protein GldC [Bacteroidetes bacterium]|nr:gliding motility protein GldC [Bacteroidota bacterium]